LWLSLLIFGWLLRFFFVLWCFASYVHALQHLVRRQGIDHLVAHCYLAIRAEGSKSLSRQIGQGIQSTQLSFRTQIVARALQRSKSSV
jgi:hypothetical protein